MKSQLYLSLTLFFFLIAFSGKTQSVLIDSPEKTYLLGKHLSLLEEESGSLTIADFKEGQQNDAFIPIQKWTADFESEKTYWAKINLQNDLKGAWQYSEWVLQFPLGNTHIDLYVNNEKGKTQHHRTGFFVPAYKKTFAPEIQPNLAKVLIPPGEKVQLLFRVHCERASIPPAFDVDLILAENYYRNLKSKKRNSALYLGFVLMMLLYNLLLFMMAGDRAYVYYSFYLLTIAIYTSYVVGDFSDWLQPLLFNEHPEYRYFGKISAYAALVSYLAFIRFFLDLKNLLPTWDRIFKTLMYASIPFLVIDLYLVVQSNFSPNVSDYMTISYIFIFLLLSSVFVIKLFQTSDRKGYFILVGLAFMMIGIFLTILMRFQSLEFTTFWFKIGSILEIIFFSLGLAYRQKDNERLKQQAEFDLVRSELIQIQEHKESERLKHLDKLKNQLYTNITHEFRTPLTVIMGMTENILGNTKEKELIRRNSQNLYHLINQMLDLAKVEAGKLEPNYIQSDLINYLRYLTESIQTAAESKSIRLHFYSEVDQLFMDFDERGIQHIVQNLLSNAIKFTPRFGQITLHAKSVQERNQPFLQIKVQDTGIGIAEKDLPHIFNRFYQGETSDHWKKQGTGIGLALTKELVELFDGKIKVQSEQGKGSTFIVQLPVKHNARKIENVSPEIDVLESVEPSLIETEQIIEHQSSEAPLVLIIEDNQDVITYIQSCLRENYQTQTAINGREGIEKAFEIIPDIVISDVMMPEKDGFEVVKTLKQDFRTSHIPIVLLTAAASEADKIAGLEHGADAYLMKPFNKKELIFRLENLIELCRQIQIHFQKGELVAPEFPQAESTKLDPEAVFIQKLRGIVEEQLSNSEFTIDDMCEEVHLSRMQLYRKLKALTTKTPTQFIRTIRMEKAIELLDSTAKNISEIAYEVGFNDPNYFSRTFQQEFGKTPSQIRK